VGGCGSRVFSSEVRNHIYIYIYRKSARPRAVPTPQFVTVSRRALWRMNTQTPMSFVSVESWSLKFQTAVSAPKPK
jgi:hypothetical protein